MSGSFMAGREPWRRFHVSGQKSDAFRASSRQVKFDEARGSTGHRTSRPAWSEPWTLLNTLKEKSDASRVSKAQAKLDGAFSAITRLAYPMVLIPASAFLQLGELVSHEELLARQLLTFADTTGQLADLRSSSRLVFFSHQWSAWDEPDLDGSQYKAMVNAIRQMQARRLLLCGLESVYIWVDYISIPQLHAAAQRKAINSLPVYAGCCDFFVIVAPSGCCHANTKQTCDAESYHRRAWCRLEQLAYACRVGVNDMLLATCDTLRSVTWERLASSLLVFDGELTCCSRAHADRNQCDRELLVTPMLGLFAELLARQRRDLLQPHMQEVLSFMLDNAARMFPSSFVFYRQGRRVGRRELFGDLVRRLLKDRASTNVLDAEVLRRSFPLMRGFLQRRSKTLDRRSSDTLTAESVSASSRGCKLRASSDCASDNPSQSSAAEDGADVSTPTQPGSRRSPWCKPFCEDSAGSTSERVRSVGRRRRSSHPSFVQQVLDAAQLSDSPAFGRRERSWDSVIRSLPLSPPKNDSLRDDSLRV